MSKIAMLTLVGATLAVNVSLTARVANAQSFLYPSPSDRNSLMVIGQGVVKVPADTADIELIFSSKDGNDELPGQTSSSSTIRPISSKTAFITDKAQVQQPLLPSKKTLTKASLKPVVDSLVASGVSAENIEVKINNNSSENIAKILVKLEKPTSDIVQSIVSTAQKATGELDNISIQKVSVNYAVNDCQALQTSAYQSAVKDAQNRAQALATSIGVKLGIPSMSEPFYSLFYPSCNYKSGVPLPSLSSFLLSPSNNFDAPAEVEMKKDIFVTYTVK